MADVEDYAHGGSPNESAEEYPDGLPKLRSELDEQRSRATVAEWTAEGATRERVVELKQERLNKALAENQARVHQEAHEPTGDWIDLADDPDEPDPRGLYRKFTVARLDGSSNPGQKHADCEYFVLDRRHDKHAPAALAAYAKSCEAERPALSADLMADPAVRAEAGKAQMPPIKYPTSCMASISADEAFRRGVAIGKAEAEVRIRIAKLDPDDYGDVGL